VETVLRRTAEPHEPVYEDGLLRIFRTGRGGRLALAGDVDASNVTRLARVLSAEARRPSGPSGGTASLHLELSGLEFMDVGGCRLLVHTAMALFGDGERRLVLHGLAPHLRRVMRVVGWDSTPGLDIAR
jgi:anti-anti-sigma factor